MNAAEQILSFIVFPVACYLIGSLVPGYWIARRRGVDLLTRGSKNIGASNVARLLGRNWGLVAFTLDLLKGFLPTFLLAWLGAYVLGGALGSQSYHLLGILYGAMAVLGHVFSIYLWFRGGKAVATGCGVFLALSPYATVLAVILWAVLFLVVRRVSVASIMAAIVLPIAALVISFSRGALGVEWPVPVFAGAVAALVLLLHRGNIQRLMAGTEPTFGKKKPETEPPEEQPCEQAPDNSKESGSS